MEKLNNTFYVAKDKDINCVLVIHSIRLSKNVKIRLIPLKGMFWKVVEQNRGRYRRFCRGKNENKFAVDCKIINLAALY